MANPLSQSEKKHFDVLGGGSLSSQNGVCWTVKMYKTYLSKWTVVQWTAYVMLIWSVQMDNGPMDHLYCVNLNRPNRRQSNGSPMLRKFGLFKWAAVKWTTYFTLVWIIQTNIIYHNSFKRCCICL